MSEYDVYVAARMLDERADWKARLTTCTSDNEMHSLKIIVKVPCTQRTTGCEHCARLSVFPAGTVFAPNLAFHFLSYSCTGGDPPFDNVHEVVDYAYNTRSKNYKFLRLTMSKEQNERVHSFLKEHLGEPFCGNFRTRFLWMTLCCCFYPLSDVRAPEEMQGNSKGYVKLAPQSWTCSELVVRALQEAGWLVDLDSRTSLPAVVWSLLRDDDRACYCPELYYGELPPKLFQNRRFKSNQKTGGKTGGKKAMKRTTPTSVYPMSICVESSM